MASAGRIGSLTSCTIWLPEGLPPIPIGASSVPAFKVATLPSEYFSSARLVLKLKIPTVKISGKIEHNAAIRGILAIARTCLWRIVDSGRKHSRSAVL